MPVNRYGQDLAHRSYYLLLRDLFTDLLTDLLTELLIQKAVPSDTGSQTIDSAYPACPRLLSCVTVDPVQYGDSQD